MQSAALVDEHCHVQHESLNHILRTHIDREREFLGIAPRYRRSYATANYMAADDTRYREQQPPISPAPMPLVPPPQPSPPRMTLPPQGRSLPRCKICGLAHTVDSSLFGACKAVARAQVRDVCIGAHLDGVPYCSEPPPSDTPRACASTQATLQDVQPAPGPLLGVEVTNRMDKLAETFISSAARVTAGHEFLSSRLDRLEDLMVTHVKERTCALDTPGAGALANRPYTAPSSPPGEMAGATGGRPAANPSPGLNASPTGKEGGASSSSDVFAGQMQNSSSGVNIAAIQAQLNDLIMRVDAVAAARGHKPSVEPSAPSTNCQHEEHHSTPDTTEETKRTSPPHVAARVSHSPTRVDESSGTHRSPSHADEPSLAERAIVQLASLMEEQRQVQQSMLEVLKEQRKEVPAQPPRLPSPQPEERVQETPRLSEHSKGMVDLLREEATQLSTSLQQRERQLQVVESERDALLRQQEQLAARVANLERQRMAQVTQSVVPPPVNDSVVSAEPADPKRLPSPQAVPVPSHYHTHGTHGIPQAATQSLMRKSSYADLAKRAMKFGKNHLMPTVTSVAHASLKYQYECAQAAMQLEEGCRQHQHDSMAAVQPSAPRSE